MQVAPDDPRPDAAVAEARAAAESGDFDGARSAIARAIDARANDPSLHAAMAWYTHQSFSLPEFERRRLWEHHLKVALDLDPQNAQAHYYQGMIWASDGNPTRGRISLATALRIQPDFSAASSALQKLTIKDQTPSVTEMRPPVAPPRRKRGLLIATAVVVLGGGAALLSLGGRNPALDGMAKRLGTSLTLISVSSVNKDLYLDAGASWLAQPEGEHAAEMANLARAARELGFDNVFVFSNARGVAESHGGAVCFGEACGARQAAQSARAVPAPAAGN